MRRTSVTDFLGNEEYGLLNPKAGSADAVCIVLSKRLNPDVFKIFKACVDAGKLVFFVVTYSENEADLSGDMEMLAEKKKQRFADVILNPWVEQNCEGPDLALLKTTPTFFVVTRLQGTTCNGDDKLQAAMRETDIKRLAQQRALLDFPALLRFLQTSLVPELRLRGHSSALVHHAIEPLTKMKFLSGAAQAVVSFAVQVASSATVVGMAGSAAFVVMRALQCAFTMLSKVGIIPDAAAQDMSSSSSLDDVMNKMDTVTNGAGRLSLWQRASSAVGIGKVTDVVRNALWVTLGTAAASMADDLAAIILASAYIGMLPFIGSAFYVATLVRMRKQIGAAVEQKAAVWHRKWIQQHVSLQEWPDAIYPFGASAADS